MMPSASRPRRRDLRAARKGEPGGTGRKHKHHGIAEDRLAEALAGAYLAMAGQDPELAAELVRGSRYLKQEAA
jgi:hypothetical protein